MSQPEPIVIALAYGYLQSRRLNRFLLMSVSSDTCYREFMGAPRPSFKYTDPPPTREETFCIHRKREVGRLPELPNTDHYKFIEIFMMLRSVSAENRWTIVEAVKVRSCHKARTAIFNGSRQL